MSSALNKTDNKPIPVRNPDFRFDSKIKRHWFGGDIFKTHVANSLTLIFPEGERFFVRTIKNFMDQIDSEELKKDARAFMGQETQHAIQHDRFFDTLRKQGYDIDSYLKLFSFLGLDIIEPIMGKKGGLAFTAGLEHYTALLAEVVLEAGMLDEAEGEMRELFLWHAAEELEHKAVAYDVLQNVDDSYFLRVVGIVAATVLLFAFAGSATAWLMWQDREEINLKTFESAYNFLFKEEKFFFKTFAIFSQYFQPSFHPWNNDNHYLAAQVWSDLKRFNKKGKANAS